MNNTVLKVTAMKTTYIYLNMLSFHIRIKGPKYSNETSVLQVYLKLFMELEEVRERSRI